MGVCGEGGCGGNARTEFLKICYGKYQTPETLKVRIFAAMIHITEYLQLYPG